MPYEIYVPHALVAVAEGSITVGATATGIPASDLDKAQGGEIEVLLTVETDQIRVSYFETADSGNHRYGVDDSIRVAGPTNCRRLSLIRVTADATVRYTIFGKAI